MVLIFPSQVKKQRRSKTASRPIPEGTRGYAYFIAQTRPSVQPIRPHGQIITSAAPHTSRSVGHSYCSPSVIARRVIFPAKQSPVSQCHCEPPFGEAVFWL